MKKQSFTGGFPDDEEHGFGAGLGPSGPDGRNQFTLQPLAIELTKGFGVAAGLGYLYLEKGREGLGKIGA